MNDPGQDTRLIKVAAAHDAKRPRLIVETRTI